MIYCFRLLFLYTPLLQDTIILIVQGILRSKITGFLLIKGIFRLGVTGSKGQWHIRRITVLYTCPGACLGKLSICTKQLAISKRDHPKTYPLPYLNSLLNIYLVLQMCTCEVKAPFHDFKYQLNKLRSLRSHEISIFYVYFMYV